MLEKELELYNNIKLDLQVKYPSGGFVVIKDDEILGVWQSRQDALRAGVDKYGNIQFLVKNINESPIAANYSRPLTFAY